MKAVLALLLCALVAATLTSAVSVGGSWNGLTTAWRLPIGAGVTPSATSLPFTSDAQNVYTTDSRGTLFAVGADGRVRWSQPGSTQVQGFFLFPNHPDVLYVLINDDYQGKYGEMLSLELLALNTADGTELGRLKNVTGGSLTSPQNYVHTTEAGVTTVTSTQGVVSTDAHLNILWTNSLPTSKQYPYYSRIAASKDTVVALFHPTWKSVRGDILSFDAKTGHLLCNVSNMTATFNEFLKLPFAVSWDTNIALACKDIYEGSNGGWRFYQGYWRQTDVRTCQRFERGIVTDAKLFGQFESATVINNTLIDANLTTGNVTTGQYELKSYQLGAESVQWTTLLPNYKNGTADANPPVVSRTAFQPDAMIVWWGGMLAAVNRTNGKIMWSFEHRLPVAAPVPPADQLVYPLGDGKLFVPNMQGFITVDIKTGAIGTVVETSPIAAAASLTDASGNPLVVVADLVSGDLVAIQK